MPFILWQLTLDLRKILWNERGFYKFPGIGNTILGRMIFDWNTKYGNIFFTQRGILNEQEKIFCIFTSRTV